MSRFCFTLVLGCYSCHRALLLLLGATLAIGCYYFLTQRLLSFQREDTPINQGGGEAHNDDHADKGHERSAQSDRVGVGLAIVCAGRRDAGNFPAFCSEGLDGGDARKVVDQ